MCSVAKPYPTLCDLMDCSLLCPWDLPGKNTGVRCLSFSRGSSRPRNQTQVSCIGRWVLYHQVTREAPFFGNKIFKEVSKLK